MLPYQRRLLADRYRTQRLGRAVAALVRPGDVVLDLGCGSGILSFMAAKAGAARVYAIEEAGVVDLARRVANAAGFGERVVFLEGAASEVEVPESVDVILAEILGSMAIDEAIADILPDVRRRWLRAGGRILPRAFVVRVAPVEAFAQFEEHVGFWGDDLYGFDFSPARSVAANCESLFEVNGMRLLSPPTTLMGGLTVALEPGTMGGEVRFGVCEAGVLHGVAGWFDAELAPGITVSSAPGSGSTTWVPVFFPVAEPVEVEPGDRVDVFLEGIPWGRRVMWNWEVSVLSEGSMEPRATSAHSTALALLSDAPPGALPDAPPGELPGAPRRPLGGASDPS